MGKLLGEDEMRAGAGGDGGQSIQEQIDKLLDLADLAGGSGPGRRLSRLEGGLLLAGYALYVGLSFITFSN